MLVRELNKEKVKLGPSQNDSKKKKKYQENDADLFS